MGPPRRAVLLLAVLALLLTACGGGSSGSDATATRTARATRTPADRTPAATATPEPPAVVPTVAPRASTPTTAPASGISLPPGFTAYVIADGFSQPTSVAVGPNGETFVSQRYGTVFRLRDANGDGVFEAKDALVSGLGVITGLMVGPDVTVYVSQTGTITTFDASGGARRDIISGLPNGRHQNNGLAIGPDGKLYLTNGSTCDDCVEGNERSAAILQANRDGSGLRVYARGLRNPYDIVFDDQGRLWATDNGSDAPCETVDEVDLITDGGNYGWPYGADGCDPFRDGTAPVANLGLHTASTGVDFYDGAQFPSQYRRSLFATLWGSLFTTPELPPQILRVVLGSPAAVETFGTGFENPIDVVVDRDGTLLVLDYGGGKLYRIVYTG